MTETATPQTFDRDRACPKCAGRAAFDWQPHGTEFMTAATGGAIVRTIARAPEWMLRTCEECGYTWPEAMATP